MAKPKRDFTQVAHDVFRRAIGEVTDAPPADESAKARAGRAGGRKGGAARAASLTAEQRSAIAKRAAAARWKGDK